MDVKNLLPEIEAREIYENLEFMDELSDDELRLVLQSVWYYDDAAFVFDVCDRWTRDKTSGFPVPSPEFHRELWKLEAERKDALYIVARDHAKTTSIKMRTLKELLFGIEKSVLFVMSRSLGEAVVGDIRRELETNMVIRFVFGSVVPNEDRTNFKTEKWRQRELQLLSGTELKTVTKGEPIRGHRPTKIRIDDPQEKKDVKNPALADEFYDWIMTSVIPTLDPSGSISVFGTVISANCFVNRLKHEATARHFRVLEYPAILDFNEAAWTGRPLWPEKWSMAALRLRYEKIGRREFLQEYQNIPFVAIGSPVFDPEYKFTIVEPISEKDGLKVYKPLTKVNENGQTVKFHRAVIGIDLASGKVGGDYSTIIARDQDKKLLAQYRGYITQDRLAAIVDDLVQNFEEAKIVPENNMALAFLDACKAYPWYRKIYRQKTVDKVTNKQTDTLGFNTNAKTKPLVINGLDRIFREGNFEVSAEEHEEILHYYYDEKGSTNAIAPYHDDLVIADALCCYGLKTGFAAPALTFL